MPEANKTIKAARTASGNQTYNTISNKDSVIILFDMPFGAGDNPAHEVFQL
jgi:hypothetical protein